MFVNQYHNRKNSFPDIKIRINNARFRRWDEKQYSSEFLPLLPISTEVVKFSKLTVG